MATSSLTRSAAAGAAVLFLSACAGTGERPVERLAKAEASIEQAEGAGARKYGVLELDAAREKFKQAQDAAKAGNMAQAERLAHAAELDAELAAAKARTRKTEKAANELEKSIRTLRDEMQHDK